MIKETGWLIIRGLCLGIFTGLAVGAYVLAAGALVSLGTSGGP